MFFTLLCHDLAVNFLIIISGKRLSFTVIKELSFLIHDFLDAIICCSDSSLVIFRVCDTQHFVVVIIDLKLHRMLVVSEESIVTVSKICHGTTLKC